MQHMAHAARAGEIEARQLANVAYGAALSGMGVSLGVQFAVLARAAEQHLGEFNAQELANTAWAFASADQLNALLFRIIISFQRVPLQPAFEIPFVDSGCVANVNGYARLSRLLLIAIAGWGGCGA